MNASIFTDLTESIMFVHVFISMYSFIHRYTFVLIVSHTQTHAKCKKCSLYLIHSIYTTTKK